MTRRAIQEVASLSSLKAAWADIRFGSSTNGRNVSGSDGISINDFSRHSDAGLKRLKEQMLSDLGYQYSPLRAAIVPKATSGNRIICIPTINDRIVQRAVSNFLSSGDKCGLLNAVSYGFIQGRSVKSAAKKAKKLRREHPWVYKTDITKFFDTLPRPRLENAVIKAVKQRSLHKTITAAIACEIEEPNGGRQKKISKAGIVEGLGVRQGMPLSPMFANIILRDFDRMVEQHGIRMVRYADDLIVLCDNEAECLDVHRLFVSELGAIGLSVPELGPGSKTVIYNPDDSAEFLGVGLVRNGGGYALHIMADQSRRICQRIAAMGSFDELVSQGVTIGKFGQKLAGVVSGYLSAYEYCDNYKTLESCVMSASNAALTLILEDGLGLKVDSLSDVQRRFLGLV